MKFSNNLHTPEMTELASRNHIRRFINSELPGAFVVPVSNVSADLTSHTNANSSNSCNGVSPNISPYIAWCKSRRG